MSTQIGELLADALGEQDEDRRHEIVLKIVCAGPERVRSQVESLLSSEEHERLRLGADLTAAMPGSDIVWLREQGYSVTDSEPFREEDILAIVPLLAAQLASSDNPDVLYACILAAEQLERLELLPGVLRSVENPDEDVRYACACALGAIHVGENCELDPAAIDALIVLARDPDDDVRDWALFRLGTAGPVDTEQARAVYRENVDHPHEGVQLEATEALALLGDVEMLVVVLESHSLIGREPIELATQLADQRLHEPLLALREEGWATTNDSELTAELSALLDGAIAATTPEHEAATPEK